MLFQVSCTFLFFCNDGVSRFPALNCLTKSGTLRRLETVEFQVSPQGVQRHVVRQLTEVLVSLLWPERSVQITRRFCLHKLCSKLLHCSLPCLWSFRLFIPWNLVSMYDRSLRVRRTIYLSAYNKNSFEKGEQFLHLVKLCLHLIKLNDKIVLFIVSIYLKKTLIYFCYLTSSDDVMTRKDEKFRCIICRCRKKRSSILIVPVLCLYLYNC